MANKKEGFDIYGFTEEDIITRVQRGYKIHYAKSDVTDEIEAVKIPQYTDYLGEKLIFKGIRNNQIYFEVISRKKLDTLSLEEFDQGWDYWEEPPKTKYDEREKQQDSDNSKSDGNGVGIEIVAGGEPPQFIKDLLGLSGGRGKDFFKEQSSILQKKKQQLDEEMTAMKKQLTEETELLEKQMIEDSKKARKRSRQFSYLFIGFYLLTLVLIYFSDKIPLAMPLNALLVLNILLFADNRNEILIKTLKRGKQAVRKYQKNVRTVSK